MFTMESLDDLWNHIAYVLAYAPTGFPYRDFLPENEQMNLDRAFNQLREGVQLAYPEPTYQQKRNDLYELLNQSLAAYKRGDELAGGHLLNTFQDGIFKP